MSFLDTLKNLGLWQGQGQPQQPQPNPYGLDQPAMRQAGLAALGNIGGQIMALSQQMTPDQRARMMAGADWTGGLQTNLYNAAQMKLMGDAQRRKQMESERDQQAQAYALEQLKAMPDSPQKRKALIYAQLGDYAKAIETAMPQAGQPNYQLVDGQVVDMNNPLGGARPVPGLQPKSQKPEYQVIDGYYVDKNNPSAPAIPVQGLPEKEKEVDPSKRLAFIDHYEKAPEVLSYNVLASEYSALAPAVYDNSKVTDLQFIYGVARALDPTSVVKDSEAGMVIEAQGLDAATLGRLNGLLGRGQIGAQQRLELLSLIKRRADGLRSQAETRRLNTLKLGEGIIDDRFLRPLPGLPEIGLPPAPRTEPGRRDLPQIPEPPLVRVEE